MRAMGLDPAAFGVQTVTTLNQSPTLISFFILLHQSLYHYHLQLHPHP
jgi:hypothetical protein